jgi:2-keto-4-pentenoate hydratase
VTVEAGRPASGFDPASIAGRFVQARRDAKGLSGFPGGVLPDNLAQAYACQDAAIALWPDEIVGWKVGRIPPALQAELGADRVMGPVFRRNLWIASDKTPTPLPIIPGGFAAVEAEYIFRMGEDAPAGKTDWTPAEALELVEAELVGVELAGSPLASINALGPKAVASDFGNNGGLILGKEIPGWRSLSQDGPVCETWMDGVLVGRGAPTDIPGTPAASLAFLLATAAARGRPLKRGHLVTTGAATGIHDIEVRQAARIRFAGVDEISCYGQAALPAGDLGGNQLEHEPAP